jgi:hypothetical protein
MATTVVTANVPRTRTAALVKSAAENRIGRAGGTSPVSLGSRGALSTGWTSDVSCGALSDGNPASPSASARAAGSGRDPSLSQSPGKSAVRSSRVWGAPVVGDSDARVGRCSTAAAFRKTSYFTLVRGLCRGAAAESDGFPCLTHWLPPQWRCQRTGYCDQTIK